MSTLTHCDLDDDAFDAYWRETWARFSDWSVTRLLDDDAMPTLRIGHTRYLPDETQGEITPSDALALAWTLARQALVALAGKGLRRVMRAVLRRQNPDESIDVIGTDEMSGSACATCTEGADS